MRQKITLCVAFLLVLPYFAMASSFHAGAIVHSGIPNIKQLGYDGSVFFEPYIGVRLSYFPSFNFDTKNRIKEQGSLVQFTHAKEKLLIPQVLLILHAKKNTEHDQKEHNSLDFSAAYLGLSFQMHKLGWTETSLVPGSTVKHVVSHNTSIPVFSISPGMFLVQDYVVLDCRLMYIYAKMNKLHESYSDLRLIFGLGVGF